MFIDIHAHAFRKPFFQIEGRKPYPTPEQLIEFYDFAGIAKAVLLPLTGPECFLSQSNEEVLEMTERYTGRFIPFCNIHPRAIDNSPFASLSDVLLKYKDVGCRGVGEVTCNMPFRDPYVQNLFRHVEIAGLPLTFHIAHGIDFTYGLYDDPGLPQLEETLQRFPNLKFLGHSPAFWAEISRLETVGDRFRYPDYPVREEGAIPRLMRRYGNLYGDLSAKSGCIALTRDPDYAVKFINEFQDRLLFGLDICWTPEKKVPDLTSFLMSLCDSGKISSDVFDKITFVNAQKLLKL